MTLSIIAAVSDNGVIGRDGKIPWKLPRDASRFRTMVEGHTLIMGAGTYRSHTIKFPRSIVVSSTLECEGPHQHTVDIVRDVDYAIQVAGNDAFVLGGHDIFKAVMPHVDRMYLTLVHAVVEGDARFPPYDASDWQVIRKRTYPADRANEYPYSFVDMVRVT